MAELCPYVAVFTKKIAGTESTAHRVFEFGCADPSKIEAVATGIRPREEGFSFDCVFVKATGEIIVRSPVGVVQQAELIGRVSDKPE